MVGEGQARSRRWRRRLVVLLLGLLLARPLPAAEGGSGPSPSTDVFGIFSIPGDERSLEALRDQEVGWVRLQYQMGEDPPAVKQAFLKRLLDEGYGLWLTLYYRDRSNIQDLERLQASVQGGFPPQDPLPFQQAIEQIVQPLLDHLKDSGKAPGRWLVIQFGNETLPDDVAPPQPVRFWHGTSEEYLEALELTYEAVKNLDPSLPVAVGGISSEQMESVLEGLGPLVKWNERLLREGRYDWADLHLYNAVESIPDKIAWVRRRWIGPLAVTECGGPDERTGVSYTEELHAQDLVRRVRAVLESGAQRVFWAHLRDIPDALDQLQEDTGLIELDWRRKPAFEAYRQLIADRHRLYFAHFGFGSEGPASLFSRITLLNPDPDQAAQVSIEFRDDAGDPLSVPLEGGQVASQLEATLPPGGSRSWQTTRDGPVRTGSAVVSADRRVAGVILFGGSVGIAGVGSSSPLREMVAPVEKAPGVNTGLALMGLGPDQVLTLALRDAQGNSLARAELELPAGAHRALFVDEIPWQEPWTAQEFQGSLWVEGEADFAATVIRQSSGLGTEFATLPVTPLLSDPGELHFPQFGDGRAGEANIFSQLVVQNLDLQRPVAVSLQVRDDQGNPLDVDLNGVAVEGTGEMTLAGSGSLFLKTDGDGPLQTGSSSAFSSGRINGVVLYGGSVGAAGVGASPAGRCFLAPVETEPGSNTGIALLALEEELELDLEVRRESGELAAQARLHLPAGGHRALFVDEVKWDRLVDFGSFSGVLKMQSRQRFSSTVILLNAGGLATLPVVPVD